MFHHPVEVYSVIDFSEKKNPERVCKVMEIWRGTFERLPTYLMARMWHWWIRIAKYSNPNGVDNLGCKGRPTWKETIEKLTMELYNYNHWQSAEWFGLNHQWREEGRSGLGLEFRVTPRRFPVLPVLEIFRRSLPSLLFLFRFQDALLRAEISRSRRTCHGTSSPDRWNGGLC